jgi:SAM-dependent methyltransferase
VRRLPTYDELQRPLPPWDPKAWSFGLQSLMLRTIGRTSRGIDLGFRHGFNSGMMLDYVYENRAQGRWGIGALLDRAFLDTIGWRGIRLRKVQLQQDLRRVIDARRGRGQATHIVDLAAGGGRYLLETLREAGESGVTALLRDLQREGLDEARRRAAEMGLRNVRFESGNAFDPGELASLSPRPDIVVVSGLYEIIPDDGLIRPHFGHIRRCLSPDGTFIFTAQPYHPQLEMIARVLPGLDGRPWVMRLRSLELLERWAREGGFTRWGAVGDPWGIFYVITASGGTAPAASGPRPEAAR